MTMSDSTLSSISMQSEVFKFFFMIKLNTFLDFTKYELIPFNVVFMSENKFLSTLNFIFSSYFATKFVRLKLVSYSFLYSRLFGVY